MHLEVKVDLRSLKKDLRGVFKKQVPFATAQMLTMTAGEVGVAWQDEMSKKLDRPTPFTMGSVAVKPARKTNLIATVYLRPVAAAYLEPLVDGGPHFLGGKKGMLTPKGVATNQYGNLSKGKIAALKAKANVFTGPVTLRSGHVVSGVWQRPGPKRAKGKASGHVGLKLLVRFTDPVEAKRVLRFNERAEVVVRDRCAPNFAKAFKAAMATSR